MIDKANAGNANSDFFNYCLSPVKCICAEKPVLSSHTKEDKKLVFKTIYGLMQVKSIAECSKGEHSAILLTCIKQ